MPVSSDPFSGPATGGRLVPTPVGDARVFVSAAWSISAQPVPGEPVPEPRGVFVVGHGAGGGVAARDLVALRDALPARGFDVVAVEQPWRVAGRRIAPAPRQLDLAWTAVLEALGALGAPGPLVVAGRSAGARVACRTASALGAAAVVALAFPLHPPGRPERSRLPELAGAGVPTLVVQGERDPFGRPGEFPVDALPGVRLCPVPAADHGFAVPASAPVSQRAALAVLVQTVGDWLDALVRGNHGWHGGCCGSQRADSGGRPC